MHWIRFTLRGVKVTRGAVWNVGLASTKKRRDDFLYRNSFNTGSCNKLDIVYNN